MFAMQLWRDFNTVIQIISGGVLAFIYNRQETKGRIDDNKCSRRSLCWATWITL